MPPCTPPRLSKVSLWFALDTGPRLIWLKTEHPLPTRVECVLLCALLSDMPIKVVFILFSSIVRASFSHLSVVGEEKKTRAKEKTKQKNKQAKKQK